MERNHQDQCVRIGLAAREYKGIARWRELIKLRARSWWYRCATVDWLSEINATELMRSIADLRPRLLIKIHRPYLTTTLSSRKRVELLRSHYDFIRKRGLGQLSLRAALNGIELASVHGRSGSIYRLRLHAVEPMEREGELVLQLSRGDQLIYSTAFVFFLEGARMMLCIGCMQGPKLEDGLDLMRDSTRDLYGLRPKQLMLKLLGEVGNRLGCDEFLLVSNANRAVRSAQRQGKVYADYDMFWLECGAMQRQDGNYQLRCNPLLPPDMATTPSSKRSAARKRYAVCETLARRISATLDHLHMSAKTPAPG